MANSLITNLTSRATLDGTEEIALNLPGTPDVDRKATIAAVKTYAQADLGTAAFADTSDFATAAQGALADSAVQPGDIGTAAAEDVGYFATAAQGAKADTASQPAEVKSANFTAANDGSYVVTASATVTDPSPSEGKGYTVIVRNGTATIGGTGYSTAGSQIRRLYHSGAWGTYVDVLSNDARLSDARTPTAHAASHVNGTDDIQDATASQKGLMTAAYATKLDGIEAAADVTDAGNVGSSIDGATAKTTPVDGDTMPLIDSAASNVLKKVTWANIKATLKTYFDTLYALTGGITSSGLTMSTDRLLGRTTASTGAVEELTAAAATAFLSAMVGDSGSGGTKGLVPAPAAGDAAGGKFLKADGTWAAPSGSGSGKILQVVQATKTDTASVTGTTFGSVFTASITPSSTSSKVLVYAMLNCGAANTNPMFIRLTRSSSTLIQGDAAGSRTRITAENYTNQPGAVQTMPIIYMDSPASTSALTYEIEIASSQSGAVYLNRSGTDTDAVTFPRAASTLILMEVGA